MLNRIAIFILFTFISVFGQAQQCNLKITGLITDAQSLSPIANVNIRLESTESGTISDKNGNFNLTNLCKKSHTLQVSHICCETIKLTFDLSQDTSLVIQMTPSDKLINDVVIKSKLKKDLAQNAQSMSVQAINDNANQNLANLLEQINGVRSLKNGSGISKPIVHGLYGNRLLILNNGINQAGQQWGNDHSPEIDPLVANQITVVKGTSAIQYLGSSLGSVILVEPKKIFRQAEINGNASLFFETNGLGSGMNLQLQKYSPLLAWKINGSLKKSGDKKTPSYFLTNTGNQELNFALQLEKTLWKDCYTDLYFSTFNTELGVLRGSHIGNLTDLTEAFQRPIPFFTNDQFSYRIDAPKQRVNHQLFKLHSKYFIDEKQWLDLTISGQINSRKEFDVRRSSVSDLPALDIKQYSFYSAVQFEKDLKNDFTFKSGLQFNLIDNTNQPETGILPLIPDYRSFQTGIFFLMTKKFQKSTFDLGLRTDQIYQNVVKISNTLPREILRYAQNFNNLNGSFGWNYDPNKNINLSWNLGYAERNPGVNEFFSGGLHQGVSGIEEGNLNLNSEKALKSTLGFKLQTNNSLSFESLVYFQSIKDYIFLKPGDEIRLTIRGAFPVFKYEQTDAQIYGLDLKSSYNILESLKAEVSYSYIKGSDISNDLPLIYMPSNNLQSLLKYDILRKLKIGSVDFENTSLEINHRLVFKQNNLLPSQDYLLPPDSYHLFGLKLATEIPISSYQIRISSNVQNLLNVKYRDYLNRQRYFADDLGINYSFVVNIKF